MSRLVILLTVLLTLALIPLAALGQGMPGFGPPPGLPAQMGPGPMGPGPMPCGPPMMMVPAPCPPPLCGPRSCEEGPKDIGKACYVGYLTAPLGVNFRFDADQVPLGGLAGLSSLSHRHSLDGMFLGCATRFGRGSTDNSCGPPESGSLQGMLKASWFFPFGHSSREEYHFGAAQGLSKREWKLDVQWLNLDVSGAYVMGASGCASAAAIAGVKFDSFQTNFKEPYNFFNFPAATMAADRADVSLMMYIPYVGAAVQANSEDGGVSAGVMMFPHVFGDISYKETFAGATRDQGTNSFYGGYFFEAFLEANRTVGSGSVGAFTRWSVLHGESRMNLDMLGGPDSQPFRFQFDRQTWIFGGKLAFSF